MKNSSKIAIVTLFGMYNYGNRLQNYAMQIIINRLGYPTETICTNGRNHYKWVLCKIRMKYCFRKCIKRWNNDKTVRKRRFADFEKYIVHSKFSLKEATDKKVLNDYKYVVYGSDQIWNTEFKTFSRLYLGFCAQKEKNIAVSASFGTDDIASKYKALFEEGLHNFKAISVREATGKDIIKKYTNLDCLVTVDPTLALKKDDWIKIERKVSVPVNYALTYFLGDFPEIDYQGYTVVNCEQNTSNGPSEFIFLIHHADRIYTDSFHACVFSIIFCIPFFVYKRKGVYSSMMSRIDTLMDEFRLCYDDTGEYYYVSKEELCKPHIKEKLNELKKCLEEYLLNSFDEKTFKH